jgi:ABC-2 type transport system permease protein
MNTTVERPVRVSTAHVGIWRRMGDIWRSRELVVAFTRTTLKVKYKNSVLGFAWSMLNPALYLVVFYVVFDVILGSGIPDFPIFLLSGLLVWNLYSTATSAATGSVLGNSGLVKKVAFAKEVLPLATVGAALVHFFLQGIVLCLALIVFRYDVADGYLPLLPLALVALLAFTCALGVFLAALNVYLRDTAHFVELGLLAWFWMTPIVYPYELVVSKLGSFGLALYRLNPLLWVVITFQRAIYGREQSTSGTGASRSVTAILPTGVDQTWYAWHLGIIVLVSSVLFVAALAFFGRAEGNFAEEL